MMDTLIQNVLELGPYLGVLALLLAGGVGMPIPEDIPLLAGGVMCHKGLADLPTMIVLTLTTIILSDYALYALGRKYGHHVSRLPWLGRYLTEARMKRAEDAFHKHGGKTLFIARFLPGIRTPVFFSAGAFKLPFWKLVVFDGAAAAMSVPTLVMLGYYGAQQIEKAERIADWAQTGLIVLAVVVIGGVVGYRWWCRRRKIVPTV